MDIFLDVLQADDDNDRLSDSTQRVPLHSPGHHA